MNSDEANTALEKACKDFIDDCPHCGARAHLVMIANEFHVVRNGDQYHYVLFRCKPCKKITLEVYKFGQNKYSNNQNLDGDGWVAKYPSEKTSVGDKLTQFVPKNVLADYEEGLKCLSVNAYKGAASMFRRSLQNSLVDLGADQDKKLIDQIKSVSKLTKDIKDWAHSVRIFGNWGAHPQNDLLKNIDKETSDEVKGFLEDFFNYVYVMPGKVAAARKTHEKSDDDKAKK